MLWLLTSLILPAHADDNDCANANVPLVAALALLPAMEDTGNTGTLTFDGDWSETLDGRIHGGQTVRVLYDPDRASLSHSHNGSPAWGVNGYALFTRADGTTATVVFQAIDFENNQGHTTNIPIPRPYDLEVPDDAVEVAFWFKNWTGGGSPGEQYDSNYSANYRFPVQPTEPTLTFGGEDTTPQPSLIGEVLAGDTLTVTYDPDRVENRGYDEDGLPVWGVEASAAFTMDDGSVRTETWDATGFELDTATGEYTPIAIPSELFIPVEATFMEVWFRHWAVGESDRYDSSGGHNYRFDVQDSERISDTLDQDTPDQDAGPTLPVGILTLGGDRPTMEDSLHAGGELTVRYSADQDYEPVSADAPPQWGVTAAVEFAMPGGATQTELVELLEHRVDETGRIYTPTLKDVALDIPEGASSLTLWYEPWVNEAPDMSESSARRYGFDIN